MGMSLTPKDLGVLAETMDKIRRIGVQVDMITVCGHAVYLGWEGPDEPVIRGIASTEGQKVKGFQVTPGSQVLRT